MAGYLSRDRIAVATAVAAPLVAPQSCCRSARAGRTRTSPYAVVEHVQEQLTRLLELTECRFEYGSLLGHPPRLEPDGAVLVGHRRWEVERWGLPADEIELRTFCNGQFCGRFMLRPQAGSKPSLQARLVAVTLADQAGRALGATQAVGEDG
jgi:hypothetical protein